MALVNKADQDELEAMVDHYGLRSVLSILMNICFDKAEHVSTNWQDNPLAQAWTRDGNKLEGWHTEVEN